MVMNEWLFTHLFWFGFSVVLITFEVLLGANFFLLWIGIVSASVGVWVWALPSILWQYQLLLFALASLISISLWWYYIKKHPAKSDSSTLNRRAEQYVGRTFSLSEAIVNGRGKIRVDDSSWQVEGADLPLGTHVEVIGVDGVILKVKAKA